MNLSKMSEGRNNNLDVIRFFAAILVIVCHSFPLSYGKTSSDYLAQYTNNRLSLGGFAVSIFFVFGGFLIAKSMDGKKNAVSYFSARCKRIFPSLIFVVCILTFVVGPIITNISVREYFTSKETFKYLANMFLIPIHNLPGVFENNVYPRVVNGALWTLPVEFMCYILIYIAYKIKLFEKKKYALTIPFVVIVTIALLFIKNNFIISVVRPIMLYYIGLGLYVFRDNIVLSRKYFLVSTIMFIVFICVKMDVLAMLVVFPYMMFYLAYGLKYKFKDFSKRGDISYGMYLWGWPIAQFVCMIFDGKIKWYINSLIVIILSIIFGYITYMIIDKRILHIGGKNGKRKNINYRS